MESQPWSELLNLVWSSSYREQSTESQEGLHISKQSIILPLRDSEISMTKWLF